FEMSTPSSSSVPRTTGISISLSPWRRTAGCSLMATPLRIVNESTGDEAPAAPVKPQWAEDRSKGEPQRSGGEHAERTERTCGANGADGASRQASGSGEVGAQQEGME